MWDNHWCSGVAKRVGALAKMMATVVDQARASGIAADLALSDPPLPIDDSNGSCDTSWPQIFQSPEPAAGRHHWAFSCRTGRLGEARSPSLLGLIVPMSH